MPDIGPQNPKEFVFANAHSGATRSESPPLIHSKLRELRRGIKGLAAVKTKDVPFPVRGAKDLNQKLAEALDDLNLIAPVIDQVVTMIPVETIPPDKNGNAVFRSLVHVKSTVRIIAEDGSFIDMVGSGHGGDRDDKGGGKASTYAWKDAILKGLTIPHEDMVDTDDEAQSAPGPVTATPKHPTVSAESKPPVLTVVRDDTISVTKDLKYVQAEIAKAKTVDDLEVIKKAIAEKTVTLSGSERLTASAAYVQRRKEILGEK